MIRVNEKRVDVSYSMVYTNPLLTLVSEKTRISAVKKIMIAFDINLNNIKFTTDLPSNKFFSFTKFYGDTFIEVSIGMEELEVVINRLKSGQDAYNVLNDVINVVKGIKDFDIKSQKVSFWKHYVAEENTDEFFENLNPNVPRGLEDLIDTKGALYNLTDEENNCMTYLMINKSLQWKNGIFIHVDIQSIPNTLSFKQMFLYSGGLFNKIFASFDLEIEENRK